MIILTGQNLVVNLYIIARDPIHKIKLKFKRAWAIRKYKISQKAKQREAERIEKEKKKALEVIAEESSDFESEDTDQESRTRSQKMRTKYRTSKTQRRNEQ